ncbi:YqiJ family protein [Leisingera sp. M658]|uniref:YqiJ family protein n=1 Tax=Leisingera sp. M658 TaxID=2867015 RepID=UPI0021A4D431|nr:YqiJ family protein [Leisingera sp. M658]UWQ73732.1 YqiJ family protein [Leisingera sp. M658]
MFDFLLDGAFAPFTLALALLGGLAVLELLALLLGGSLIGSDGDAGLDAADGADIGAFPDAGDLGDLGDLGGVDLADLDGVDAPDSAGAADASGGLASWLGLGRMPALIWLAALLMGFGLSGIGLQMVLMSYLGFAAPAWMAGLPAGAFGLWFARGFGGMFARLLPQTETEALSERSLGRRRGVITQGTAAQGRPAEVRVTDGYGNAHYLRAEPFAAGEELSQGTEVLVMRDRRKDRFVLIPLSD